MPDQSTVKSQSFQHMHLEHVRHTDTFGHDNPISTNHSLQMIVGQAVLLTRCFVSLDNGDVDTRKLSLFQLQQNVQVLTFC